MVLPRIADDLYKMAQQNHNSCNVAAVRHSKLARILPSRTRPKADLCKKSRLMASCRFAVAVENSSKPSAPRNVVRVQPHSCLQASSVKARKWHSAIAAVALI
jgi:hypothetical protein